jgi:hypothetical protein
VIESRHIVDPKRFGRRCSMQNVCGNGGRFVHQSYLRGTSVRVNDPQVIKAHFMS